MKQKKLSGGQKKLLQNQFHGKYTADGPPVLPGNKLILQIWQMVGNQLIVTAGGDILGVVQSAIFKWCEFFELSKQNTIEIFQKIKILEAIHFHEPAEIRRKKRKKEEKKKNAKNR